MDNGDDTQRLPRITKAYAKSLIAMERIVVDTDMSVVIVMVKLKNRQRFVADAIVANTEIFDPERGTQIAREKIYRKIIDAEMYQLRTKLHEQKNKEVNDVD